MAIFEFISVMVSIVLGLSLAQILTGLSQFARNSRRVEAYLPHTLWLINLVLLHFLMWWSFWDYRDVEWNYARFLVIVMEPLLIFLMTSMLIPRDFGRDVIDLSDYFHEVRRWFFLPFIILNCFFVLDGPMVFHSESMWISYRLIQTFVMAALLLGLLNRRSWAQHLSASALLSMLIWSSAVRFLPAAFE